MGLRRRKNKGSGADDDDDDDDGPAAPHTGGSDIKLEDGENPAKSTEPLLLNVQEVSSSYNVPTSNDVGVLEMLARQAAKLADPTLLWVVLQQRERMIRRMSRENIVAADACAASLGKDVAETNRQRRNACIEDKAKATERALGKLMLRKRCTRKDPPRSIAVAEVPVSAIPVPDSIAPAAPAVPRTDGAAGVRVRKAKPTVCSWAGVPFKYRIKYKLMKKYNKATTKYIAAMVTGLQERKERLKAAAKDVNKRAGRTLVVTRGLPKQPPQPSAVRRQIENTMDGKATDASKRQRAVAPVLRADALAVPSAAAPHTGGEQPATKVDSKPEGTPKAGGTPEKWTCHSVQRSPAGEHKMPKCMRENLWNTESARSAA